MMAGSYSVVVRMTDNGNNQRTEVFQFEVSEAAATAPVASFVTPHSVYEIANNLPSRSNDLTPTLQGSTDAGNKVIIYTSVVNAAGIREAGVEIGQATANANGVWSFDFPSDLTEGEHTFLVFSETPAGERSAQGTSVTIDLMVREVPAGTMTIDPTVLTSRQVNGETQTFLTDGTPQITVEGLLAGETQRIIIRNGQNIIHDQWVTTTDSQTSIAITTSQLGQGEFTLSLEIQDSFGNAGTQPANQHISVIIDTVAPTAPTVSVANSAGFASDGTTDVVSQDAARFSGTGEAGSQISVEIRRSGSSDWQSYGTTEVDANGDWAFNGLLDIRVALNDGIYEYRVSASDLAGQRSPFTSGNFEHDSTVDFTSIPDKTVNTNVQEFTATVESGSTVTINGVDFNGVAVGINDGVHGSVSTTDWTFNLLDVLQATTISDGTYDVRFTVRDTFGNEQEFTESIVYKSTLAAPEVSLEGNSITLASTVTTTDRTPLFEGTAEAGARVEIRGQIDGQGGFINLGQATVADDGTWSVQVNTIEQQLLNDQNVDILVDVRDVYQNLNSFTFTLDPV